MKGQGDERQQDRESREENLPSRGSLRGPPKASDRYKGPEEDFPVGGRFSAWRLSALLPLIVLSLKSFSRERVQSD